MSLDHIMTPPQAASTRATVETLVALFEAIRELGSVPNGVLYAQVMGTISLRDYERAIDLLKGAQLVTESGHVLTCSAPRV